MSDENSLKWHRRFLGIAREVSTWSKDPSTKVGAVLVKDRKILRTGYNGFPPGIADDPERLGDRAEKLRLTIHAEMNALLGAGREETEGATIYTYPIPPCSNCAKHIIAAGIKMYVSIVSADMSDEIIEARYGRWRDEFAKACRMFEEAGVEWAYVGLNS